MTPNEVSELKDAYHDTRKEYSKCIKKSKRDSWRKFTTECEDIYMLNKIIFKKQQNATAIMEGCNTGLQSNNVLPGSTPTQNASSSKKFAKYKFVKDRN